MDAINNLFKIHKAKSKAFSDHDKGIIPFVSNGFANNGVVGFVEPLPSDKVFQFEGICISVFGEATVQYPPFIARGNGGSGLSVLEPDKSMAKSELYWYASYINQAIRWRFSFGRMLKKERLEKLQFPYFETATIPDFAALVPNKPKKMKLVFQEIHWGKFKVSKLFNVKRGDFHSLARLVDGDVMTVSRISENNGIAGYFERPEKAQLHSTGDITVSTLGGDSFVQINSFMATDNVLILTPKIPLSIEVRFFIVFMLNRDKWRYSYGRQSYKTKFEQAELLLPVTDSGIIDEAFIKLMIKQTTYWSLVSKVFTSGEKRKMRKVEEL